MAMSSMNVCRRCAGCGWVGGLRGWERPLTELARTREQQLALPSVIVPHPCGQCGGAGALLAPIANAVRLPRAFLYGRGPLRN